MTPALSPQPKPGAFGSSRTGAGAEAPEPWLSLVPASPLHGGHRGTSTTCKMPSEPSGDDATREVSHGATPALKLTEMRAARCWARGRGLRAPRAPRTQHLHRGDEVPLQGRLTAPRGYSGSGKAAAGGGRSTLTAPGHSSDSAGRKELQLLALAGERGSIAARPRAGGRHRDGGSGHCEGGFSLHPGVLRWVVPPPAPGLAALGRG